MSRTTFGNLIGAAAATERHDFFDSLIPSQLTDLDRARIKVDTLEGILSSTDASFVEFRTRITSDLEAARAEFKDLEDQEALARIDAAELPFELDGTQPSPWISGGEVVEFGSAKWFDRIKPIEF
jgi:hypothetical protein